MNDDGEEGWMNRLIYSTVFTKDDIVDGSGAGEGFQYVEIYG